MDGVKTAAMDVTSTAIGAVVIEDKGGGGGGEENGVAEIPNGVIGTGGPSAVGEAAPEFPSEVNDHSITYNSMPSSDVCTKFLLERPSRTTACQNLFVFCQVL